MLEYRKINRVFTFGCCDVAPPPHSQMAACVWLRFPHSTAIYFRSDSRRRMASNSVEHSFWEGVYYRGETLLPLSPIRTCDRGWLWLCGCVAVCVGQSKCGLSKYPLMCLPPACLPTCCQPACQPVYLACVWMATFFRPVHTYIHTYIQTCIHTCIYTQLPIYSTGCLLKTWPLQGWSNHHWPSRHVPLGTMH